MKWHAPGAKFTRIENDEILLQISQGLRENSSQSQIRRSSKNNELLTQKSRNERLQGQSENDKLLA